jgi:general secretion pathway protein I
MRELENSFSFSGDAGGTPATRAPVARRVLGVAHTGRMPVPQRGGIRRRGFTLIEVLATVAFIAIVLPVAMQGISLSVRTAGNARKQAEAAILAQSKLDETLAALAVDATTTGTVEEDGIYHVQTTVTPGVDPANLGLTLDELTVMVSWPDRDTERQVRLSTWNYRAAQ